MNNEEKGIIYDNCLRESDRLQRENSRLKSQYVTNIPPQVQEQINQNNTRIAVLVNKLENLLR
jgi:hypothetical protein